MDGSRDPSDNRVLIATSILLDGRVVYGPTSGLDVKQLLFETGDRSTLERWMLRLALAAKPPTGFMHDIVVEDTGERKGTFDIKHGGLLPVVDLARYAALRAGVRATPTIERLRAATDGASWRPTEARILEEAFDLFSALRLEHQVSQLERGSPARRPPGSKGPRPAHQAISARRLPGGLRRAADTHGRALAALAGGWPRDTGGSRVRGGGVARCGHPVAGGDLHRDRPGDHRARSGDRRDHLLRHPDRVRRQGRLDDARYELVDHTGCPTPTRSASTACASPISSARPLCPS